jgi:hypothetical protein
MQKKRGYYDWSPYFQSAIHEYRVCLNGTAIMQKKVWRYQRDNQRVVNRSTDNTMVNRASEWLLFNANSAIFHLYHGETKLIYNEMMMRHALYQTNTLSWIFIVLAHWNNNPQIDMSSHSDTLSWFWAKQSLLFLLNAACLAEKQQIQILVFGFTQSGLEPTIYLYHTRGEYTNHYTPDAVQWSKIQKWFTKYYTENQRLSNINSTRKLGVN